MKSYIYLSLAPESLIVSHLPPGEFGAYLAVGTQNRSRGQALVIELNAEAAGDYHLLRDPETRCLPHRDGSPRRSTYLAIYRVLEQVPMAALGQLHLVTSDGRVLSRDPQPAPPPADHCFHLYQEFCPVTPRVVSTLGPSDFCARLTDPSEFVSVPKLAFAELSLGSLANDIESPDVGNLPYAGLPHLRDCLRELNRKPGKPTKVAVRHVRDDVLFRTILGGFYVGQHRDLKFYPIPSLAELESDFHEWWSSAQASYGS